MLDTHQTDGPPSPSRTGSSSDTVLTLCLTRTKPMARPRPAGQASSRPRHTGPCPLGTPRQGLWLSWRGRLGSRRHLSSHASWPLHGSHPPAANTRGVRSIYFNHTTCVAQYPNHPSATHLQRLALHEGQVDEHFRALADTLGTKVCKVEDCCNRGQTEHIS